MTIPFQLGLPRINKDVRVYPVSVDGFPLFLSEVHLPEIVMDPEEIDRLVHECIARDVAALVSGEWNPWEKKA